MLYLIVIDHLSALGWIPSHCGTIWHCFGRRMIFRFPCFISLFHGEPALWEAGDVGRWAWRS
ncbi:MAG: hypothetical protein ACRCUE_18770, partial [Bosea sp. (in: a-proteobacteria)]